ncbi:MAG: Hsp70 family protein [Synechococcus sp.]|nr:Hsp70 family protein [Synechococcus sp.]
MGGTLALDLGSSTTVLAWQEPGQPPHLLPLPPFSLEDPEVVPSLLWLRQPDDPRPLIGRQVLDAGLAEEAGPGLIRDFKRRIGASAESPPPEPPAAEAGWLAPEQAATLLVERLWQALPATITPQRLVLTAPIETYRGYRAWLRQLAARLPVAEMALVDEPTAAAIGAGLAPGSRVLVVDLGGGTIDLSLVALEGGQGRAAPIAQLLRFAGRDLDDSRQALRLARVIGKAGSSLGGRDLDRWIAASLHPHEPPGPALLQAAERLKCRLSHTDREGEELLELALPEPGRRLELRLDRRGLESLLLQRGLLDHLDGLLEAVAAAARREGLELGRLDAVLPVGGSSRMPLIRRWLQERLATVPLHGQRPVEAVALGALALTPGVRLRDVLAHGVSLRCWDRRSDRHRWHPLFLPGQPWPTERPLELVLAASRDGQRDLELVLGEPQPQERGEVLFENGLPVLRARPAGTAPVVPWPAAPLRLPLQPAAAAGEDRLRLRFSIDAEGWLQLEGEDLGSGAALGPLALGPLR